MLSKGWYHVDDQLVMVKGNSITEAGTAGYEPYSEVMASLIAQVLGLPHLDELYSDYLGHLADSCIIERKKASALSS